MRFGPRVSPLPPGRGVGISAPCPVEIVVSHPGQVAAVSPLEFTMVPRDILGRPLLVVEILPSKSHDDPALTEVARVEVPPSSKVFILAAAGYRVVPSSASRTITVRDDRG